MKTEVKRIMEIGLFNKQIYMADISNDCKIIGTDTLMLGTLKLSKLYLCDNLIKTYFKIHE